MFHIPFFRQDPNTAFIYLTLAIAVSTILSMYGLIIIFKASRTHLSHFKVGMGVVITLIAHVI